MRGHTLGTMTVNAVLAALNNNMFSAQQGFMYPSLVEINSRSRSSHKRKQNSRKSGFPKTLVLAKPQNFQKISPESKSPDPQVFQHSKGSLSTIMRLGGDLVHRV